MGYKVPIFAKTGKYHTEWWSCRNYDRRSAVSFAHLAALVDPEGNIVMKVSVPCYDRTWERYPGDKVRRHLGDRIKARMPELAASEAVKPLVDELMTSKEVEPVHTDRGTRIGYSLSMCCPM